MQKEPKLEKIRWEDIRERVLYKNPLFAKFIDKIEPDSNFPLYIAKYPFGSTILDEGRFRLPFNHELIDIEDPLCPKNLQTELGYNVGSVPIGFILNNSVELFITADNRIIPFSVITKGKIFGLWSALNPETSGFVARKAWSMVAGSRFISVLPRLTDAASFKKLRKARNIRSQLPRTLLDHGPLLEQMANHKDFPSEWYAEILFFPKKWLTHHKGEAWAEFRLFLYETACQSANYWCNKVVYDCVWHTIIRDFAQQNIKVMPHVIDIVDHLIKMMLGILPGFAPALDDTMAPVNSFKADFVNIYGLKRFAPTIMVPTHLTETLNRPVYWSMQLPTHFGTNPKPRKLQSVIADLREIRYLLRKFRRAVLEDKIPVITGTPFYDFMKKVHFEYFHSDVGPDDEILPSLEMVTKDLTLIDCDSEFGSRSFSEVSPFVRGCISISLKNTNNS